MVKKQVAVDELLAVDTATSDTKVWLLNVPPKRKRSARHDQNIMSSNKKKFFSGKNRVYACYAG